MTIDVSTFVSENSVLISAIFGGAGVKVIDKFLSRKSDAFDHAEQLRDEMRIQIAGLRDEINAKRIEADEWRSKYWVQMEETVQLKMEVEGLRNELELIKLRVFGPFTSPSTGSLR